MKELKVKLTFTEDLLGTASSNPGIHEEFIASKSPDAKTIAEEVAAVGVEEVVEKVNDDFPEAGGRHAVRLRLPDTRLFQGGLLLPEKGQGNAER